MTEPNAAERLARADVAARIARLVRSQALRSELWIARIRVVVVVAYAALDWVGYARPDLLLFGGLSVSISIPLTISALSVLAIAFLLVLERGHYHSRVSVVVPIVDAVFLALIAADGLQVLGASAFVTLGLLERLALVSTLLAISGGLRLTRAAALISTLAAMATYSSVAARITSLGQVVFSISLISGVGLVGALMAEVVRRAMQREIGTLALERFLPRRVLEGAHRDPIAILGPPRVADVTVLISDLRGFTTLAEAMKPDDLMALLNEVQGDLARAVDQHGGTVDKFMGDGMLAVFGAVEPLADHAHAAIAAAHGIRAAIARLNEKRRAIDLADLRVGIGVHSGPVVAGCLGGGPRLEFTVLGDTVNVASRLEAMTKERGVDVLVSEETARLAGEDASLVPLGEAAIRGRAGATRIFTLATPAPATAHRPA
jgi:class 3 adenylate cyclase